jgi:hypothetical protein
VILRIILSGTRHKYFLKYDSDTTYTQSLDGALHFTHSLIKLPSSYNLGITVLFFLNLSSKSSLGSLMAFLPCSYFAYIFRKSLILLLLILKYQCWLRNWPGLGIQLNLSWNLNSAAFISWLDALLRIVLTNSNSFNVQGRWFFLDVVTLSRTRSWLAALLAVLASAAASA